MIELNKKNIAMMKELFPSTQNKGERLVKATTRGTAKKITIEEIKRRG